MKLEIILAVTGLAFSFVDAVVYNNVTGVLGESTVLPCSIPVKSYTIEWKSKKLGHISRNWYVLQQPHKFKPREQNNYGDWGLRVFNVSAADADFYVCTAGPYRTEVTLFVKGRPTTVPYDEKTTVPNQETTQDVILTTNEITIRISSTAKSQEITKPTRTKKPKSSNAEATSSSVRSILAQTSLSYIDDVSSRPTTMPYAEKTTVPNQETTQDVILTTNQTTIQTSSTAKWQEITKPTRAKKPNSGRPTTMPYAETTTVPNQETTQDVISTTNQTTIQTSSTAKWQEITKPTRAKKPNSDRQTSVPYPEKTTVPNQETTQDINLTTNQTTIRKLQEITKPTRAQKPKSSEAEVTSSSVRTNSASILAQTNLSSLICYIWIAFQI